jgi:hypothetical protein
VFFSALLSFGGHGIVVSRERGELDARDVDGTDVRLSSTSGPP